MSLPYCFRSQLFRSGSATGQQCTHCGIGAVPWCVVLVPPIPMGCRPPPFAQCVCQYQVLLEKTLAPRKINARHKKACQKNLFFYIQVSSPRPVLCKVCTVFTVAHCVLASPTPTSRLPRCSNYLFLTIYSNGDLFLQSVSGMRARNTISRFPPNSNKISAKLANFAFFEFVFCLEEISIDKNRIWSR